MLYNELVLIFKYKKVTVKYKINVHFKKVSHKTQEKKNTSRKRSLLFAASFKIPRR